MPSLAELLIQGGPGARGRANTAPIPEMSNDERLDRLKSVGLGAVDVLGVPSMIAGELGGQEWQDAIRGPQERHPGGAMAGALLGAGPVGTAAGALGRGAGAALDMVRASPKMAALLAGGLGIATPSEAGDATANDHLQGLYASREQAEARRKAAEVEAAKQSRTGKGPMYLDAQAKAEAARAEVAGLDKLISDENKKNDPEYIRQQREADLASAQAAKDAELDKPFAERHPWISTGMTLAGPLAAGAMAKYGMGKIASKGESLMADLLKAKEAGNVTDIADTAAKMQQWSRWAPTKQATVLGASAAIPLELRAAGDNIDKYALPTKSEAQQDAAERLSDPVGYVKSSLPLLLSGAAGAAVGSKFANAAPRGDVKAMVGRYGNKDEAALQEQLTNGADLSTLLQGPIGRFQQASQARSANAGAGSMLQTGNDEAARRLGSLSASPTLPAPLQSRGTSASSSPSIDHNWDSKTGRWRKPDGKFAPGTAPED